MTEPITMRAMGLTVHSSIQIALLRDLVAGQERKIARLERALSAIAEQDWVENCLDPQWAARIAKEALGERS